MPQKVYILVEGEEDSNFLQSYIQYLLCDCSKECNCSVNINEEDSSVTISRHNASVEIKNAEGKGNLAGQCNMIGRRLRNGYRVLIVFDANGDYIRTKSKKEKIVEDKTSKNSRNSDLDFFFLPNDKDSGALENLLEKMIKTECKGVFSCFEAYKKCLKQQAYSYHPPNDKTKIHAYKDALGATKKGKKYHFNPEYWDFESSALGPLRDFLSQNFLKSEINLR